MPKNNYIATLKITRITDGNRAFAEWGAEFDCESKFCVVAGEAR